MTNSSLQKPPTWFWVVSGLALLWNAMGVMAYLGQVYMSDEAMAALPQEQQDIYAAQPAWATGAFALAVFVGLAACIALLMRKSWATMLFIISLVAVIVQNIYFLFMANVISVMGAAAIVMPIIVFAILIYLIWFSKKATAEKWIG